MGANPVLVVRVAGNLAELRANLAEGKTQIETTTSAMAKLASSFNGDKLIQSAMNVTAAVDQIGGTSKLTDAELARVNATLDRALEKYKLLGKEAPPGMQALADATRKIEPPMTLADRAAGFFTGTIGKLAAAFSISSLIDRTVGSLVSMTQEVIANAGALVDMSAKTGLSTDTLQRFAFVGKQANVSVDDLSQAAFKLGINLDGGEKSVRQAVVKLGLSYDDLRRSSPDEQFAKIVAALEAMVDPQERNRLGVELFGKSFATIVPAVASGYTEMAKQARISSEAQLQAIDRTSDAWDRFVANQKTSITSMLGNWVLMREQVGKLTDEQMLHYQTLIKGGGDAEAYLRFVAHQVDIVLPKQKALTDNSKEAQAAAEKHAAAMIELNSAGQGWRGTLEGIDGAMVEAIKFYLQAGVSQGDLATAYGLTAAQVKAVASSLADELAATKSLIEFRDIAHKRQVEITEIQIAEQLKRAAVVNDAVAAELAAQEQLNAAFNLDVQGRQKSTSAAETLRLAMEALHRTKVEGVSQTKQEQVLIDAYTKALYDEATAQDAANGRLAQVPQLAAAASNAIKGVTQSFFEAIDAAARLAGVTVVGHRPGEPGSEMFSGAVGPAAPSTGFSLGPGFSLGHRAGGGDVRAGMPYVVGEKRPELFVPETNGTILPSVPGGTASGAISLTIASGAVQINYPIMNDPRARVELVNLLSDALMARLRAGGLRVPTGG